MKIKFRVYMTVTVPISTMIEVEADPVGEDVQAVADAAIQKLLNNPAYRVLDFDGNKVAYTETDIQVDNIE